MSDLFGPSTSTATQAPTRRSSTHNRELPIPLDLLVDDRDVISALMEYPEGDERNQFALEALKIGVLALRHVGGQATADLIQREVRGMQQVFEQHKQMLLEQLTLMLKDYFDPQDGRFSDRVKRLVGHDGELVQLLKDQIGGDNSVLAQTLLTHVGKNSPLMQQLGPDESKGLLALLKLTVERQLVEQRDTILKEFSLDTPNGALKRLVNELTGKHGDLSKDIQLKIDGVVKEFSFNDENSALSRMVQSVTKAQRTITDEFSLNSETSCLSRLKRELMTILEAHVKTNAEFQEEVKGALRALTARREEQARSTLHGGTFQSAMFEFVHHQSASRGDVAEFTADHVGAIKNCKVGDVVLELGPDTGTPEAKIVFEAKEERGYSLKKSLEELEIARKNRSSQVGVFVFSKKTAPQNLQPLGRFGNDIVVCWDSEDGLTDSFLWAAIELARLMCLRGQRQSDSHATDFVAIETAIHDIEKHANNLKEVRSHAETIQSASDKIIRRIDIDRSAFEKQVILLREKFGGIREGMNPQE